MAVPDPNPPEEAFRRRSFIVFAVLLTVLVVGVLATTVCRAPQSQGECGDKYGGYGSYGGAVLINENSFAAPEHRGIDKDTPVKLLTRVFAGMVALGSFVLGCALLVRR